MWDCRFRRRAAPTASIFLASSRFASCSPARPHAGTQPLDDLFNGYRERLSRENGEENIHGKIFGALVHPFHPVRRVWQRSDRFHTCGAFDYAFAYKDFSPANVHINSDAAINRHTPAADQHSCSRWKTGMHVSGQRL